MLLTDEKELIIYTCGNQRIILGEKATPQSYKSYKFTFIQHLQNDKNIEMENRSVVDPESGWQEGGKCGS